MLLRRISHGGGGRLRSRFRRVAGRLGAGAGFVRFVGCGALRRRRRRCGGDVGAAMGAARLLLLGRSGGLSLGSGLERRCGSSGRLFVSVDLF